MWTSMKEITAMHRKTLVPWKFSLNTNILGIIVDRKWNHSWHIKDDILYLPPPQSLAWCLPYGKCSSIEWMKYRNEVVPFWRLSCHYVEQYSHSKQSVGVPWWISNVYLLIWFYDLSSMQYKEVIVIAGHFISTEIWKVLKRLYKHKNMEST